MDISDPVLVEKIKTGDYQAFESLVNRYESKVYRLAIRMLRNPEDAEDAIQENLDVGCHTRVQLVIERWVTRRSGHPYVSN
ncbi:MAG: sigma factor [Thermodesulfobacteriota bacterium]